jgi:hypothetical protein
MIGISMTPRFCRQRRLSQLGGLESRHLDAPWTRVGRRKTFASIEIIG